MASITIHLFQAFNIHTSVDSGRVKQIDFFPEQIHHINVPVLHPEPKKRLNSISSETNSCQKQEPQKKIDN